jgi:tight adherence protein C
MDELPVLALSFTVTTMVAFVALLTITLFRREEYPGDEPTVRVFGPLTPVFASLLPSSRIGRLKIAKDLLRAGFFEPVAEVNFTAIRSLMTYLPLVGCEVGAILTDGNVSILFFLIGVLGGLLGYTIPRVILSFAAAQRTEEIRRGLPMLMDTLGLTLSTGASLIGALAASGEAIRRGYGALSQEVRVVVAQASLRSLSHALDAWKERQPLPELGSLVFLLGQADRFGTDITRGLWELSGSLQMSARQRAESAANRANFYMSFPTVLCLLVAAGIVLAGPGIAQVIQSNRDAQKFIQKAREDAENLRKEKEGQEKGKAAPPKQKQTGLVSAPTPSP